MKIPLKRGKPLKLWYEPWGEVWVDPVQPDFASLAYDVWVPNVNFYEGKNTYNIRVELPGIDKNKIDVYVDSKTNAITIRGIRTCKEDKEAQKCHVRESVFGPFSRRIHLPSDVHADKTEATYKDGVLSLIVPKTKTPKAKKIEITE